MLSAAVIWGMLRRVLLLLEGCRAECCCYLRNAASSTAVVVLSAIVAVWMPC